MNMSQARGYQRKSRDQLIKAIQDCTSLSQLFALIQLEGITLQMHSQPGASNLAPRRLTPQDIINNNDTPLERLKAEVLKAIGFKPPRRSYEDKSRLLRQIDSCTTLSELFELIQKEKVVIQMHAQPGASNLTPRVLSPQEMVDENDTPFERLKAEVRRAVVEQ